MVNSKSCGGRKDEVQEEVGRSNRLRIHRCNLRTEKVFFGPSWGSYLRARATCCSRLAEPSTCCPVLQVFESVVGRSDLFPSCQPKAKVPSLTMPKIHIVHTAPINPPGSSIRLTRTQAWAGLARKARHPEDFVPVVAGCEILRDTAVSSPGADSIRPVSSNLSADDDEIECIVHFRPGVPHATQIRETCKLSAPCRLDYTMEDGSTAVNLIGVGPPLLPSVLANAEGEGGKSGDEEEELYLTFAFCWEHAGLEKNGEEERVLRARYEQVSCFLLFLCPCLPFLRCCYLVAFFLTTSQIAARAVRETIAGMRKLALATREQDDPLAA